MKINQKTKFMLALAIGLIIVTSILTTTKESTNRISVSESDSNNGTVFYTGIARSFKDAKYDTCTSVAIYNGTNAVDATGNFTITNCQATLVGTIYNGSQPRINYTGTDNDVIDSQVSESLFNVLSYLLIAAGIFYLWSKME